MQVENSRDQIDYYQNVGTKLIVTPKCRDQNDVFTIYIYIYIIYNSIVIKEEDLNLNGSYRKSRRCQLSYKILRNYFYLKAKPSLHSFTFLVLFFAT